MDILQHECGIAGLRLLNGNFPTKIVPMTLEMMRMQSHRGRQGAGIGVLSAASGKMTVRRYRGDHPVTGLEEMIATEKPMAGDIAIGHVRYATNGCEGIGSVHPFLYTGKCASDSLLLCGNFHLTAFENAVEPHSLAFSIGRAIEENESVEQGLASVLKEADGGFALCGITGNGTLFAVRDRHGIRPAYYVCTDTFVAIASERPPLAAIAGDGCKVLEIPPGHMLAIDASGEMSLKRILPHGQRRACVFERIYFSSSEDKEIQSERTALGRALAPEIERRLGSNAGNVLVTFVPNTARDAWNGVCESLHLPNIKFAELITKVNPERNFIAAPSTRGAISAQTFSLCHVDIAADVDTIVVIDDSIVRGTTLKHAVLPLLQQLRPRRIIVASATPAVKFPDCYGIDLPTFSELIAFRAALRLSVDEKENPQELYAGVSDEKLNRGIALELAEKLDGVEVEVVYNTVETLHRTFPRHRGDWYFTGDYPTHGGERFACESFYEATEQTISGR